MHHKVAIVLSLLLAATMQAQAFLPVPELDPGMSVAPCTLGILTLLMVSDRFRRR